MTATSSEPVFSLGPHTLTVHMVLHEKNRKRLVQRLQAMGTEVSDAMVVLVGGESEDALRYSSDTGDPFRQESFFHWAFGVLDPDWYGSVDAKTGKSYLFMPKLHESYEIWDGKIKAAEEYKSRYAVDEVHFVEDMTKVFRETGRPKLLTLHGMNTDSGHWTKEAVYEGFSQFKVDNRVLYPVISELRSIKTEEELEVMRFTAKRSAEAHIEVMKLARVGMMEYHLEAIFRHYCMFYGGMRNTAYTCISASGRQGAVLHYGSSNAPNDKVINDGDLCLLDMGGEYYCYISDITCTYPINGKFTEDQKAVYNAVLAASRGVMEAVKPGVSWVDMHLLAQKVILEHLVKIGMLKGSVDEMMEANLGSTFMPHGLGHLIGCDTHDVGGYLEHHPQRPTRFGLDGLRTARVLEEGMAVTIEPGCYFSSPLTKKALDDPKLSKFIVPEVLERFKTFGGVRIEDNVVITRDGMELLSVGLPRTVEDIEAVMKSGRRLNVPLPTKWDSGVKFSNYLEDRYNLE